MAISVGDAVLKITGDAGDLDKALDGIEGKVKKATTNWKMVGLAAGGVAIGAAGAIFGAAKAAASTADNLEEMGQRTGLSTTLLQELGYAAKLSGTSIEGLEVGTKRMAVTINDAATGSQQAKDKLTALGLSIEDLQGLTPDQQLLKLAGALAAVQDPTTKAALAIDIFGRSGTDMLPMLAGGAQGLDDMRNKAHELGIVMGEEAVAQGASFNDALDSLTAQFGGLVNQIGIAVVPALRPLIDAFSELIKVLPLKEFGELLGELLPPLVEILVMLMKALPIKEIIQLVELALKPLFSILTLVMTILEPVIEALTFLINIVMVGLKPVFDIIAGIGDALSGIFGTAFKEFKLPSFEGFEGIIPGVPGTPMLATVHAGETIGQGAAYHSEVNIYNPSVRSDQDITEITKQVSREMYRMQQVRHG